MSKVPSEQINAVLEVFQERIGAIAVALLDLNSSGVDGVHADAGAGYWRRVRELDCLESDGRNLVRKVGLMRTLEVSCGCGHHFLSYMAVGRYPMPGRWTLAALTTEPLTRAPDESPLVITVAETATHGALADLREILRDSPSDDRASDDLDLLSSDPAGGSGGAGSAELGLPRRWARKPS